MRTNSRIRGQLLVLAALTVVVSVPELAWGQQAGLFPLAPIKRQRPPCDQEDPIYKIYKDKYFGYHPTCWRQFPAGWGCPSAERPDLAESLKKYRFMGGEPEVPALGEGEEGMEPQPAVTRPARPALPGGGRAPSPFEDPAATPANPRGGLRPAPPETRDPFDLDRPTPATPRTGEPAPGAASNGPELSAPADQPATRTSRTEADDNGNDSDDAAPVLALPAINVPTITDAGVPFGVEPPSANPNVASNSGTNSNAAAAAPAAPRRGMLSGFFSNLGLNWTRR